MRDLFFSRLRPLRSADGSNAAEVDAPRVVYPAAVDDSGKRLDAKSNAEDTENDLMCRPGLAFDVRRVSAKGSSSPNDCLDEGTPALELDKEALPVDSEEEASEASSKESRAALFGGADRFEKAGRDMVETP